MFNVNMKGIMEQQNNKPVQELKARCGLSEGAMSATFTLNPSS